VLYPVLLTEWVWQLHSDLNGSKTLCHPWQVQAHTEQPVGMALYEMKNGQISNICIQGGKCRRANPL
jgi:hypothetical protein